MVKKEQKIFTAEFFVAGVAESEVRLSDESSISFCVLRQEGAASAFKRGDTVTVTFTAQAEAPEASTPGRPAPASVDTPEPIIK